MADKNDYVAPPGASSGQSDYVAPPGQTVQQNDYVAPPSAQSSQQSDRLSLYYVNDCLERRKWLVYEIVRNSLHPSF